MEQSSPSIVLTMIDEGEKTMGNGGFVAELHPLVEKRLVVVRIILRDPR